jgi:VCBS repeat-containing protein
LITIRKSDDRGFSDHDWLKSFHTFSFADYQDSNHMGFGNIRVINQDKVFPGKGFGTHSHRDMEIISYVIDGELEHKDSLGNGSVIKPGEIQKMSAGTGISHSEFNPSKTNLLHFLQIWIIPAEKNLEPSYEQNTIPVNNTDQLILIGSNKKNNDVVYIHQDVELFAAYMKKNSHISYQLQNNRSAWIQLIKGDIQVNSISIHAGDGVAINEENSVEITAQGDVELLLFDLGK